MSNQTHCAPLTWQQFFCAIVAVCATKSKDPHTKVGAVIVNNLNQIISTGFNGLPRGLADAKYPWKRTGLASEIKYTYVVHAEVNAILSSRTDIRGMDLYTSLFPCPNCAKIIVQSEFKTVYYIDDCYAGTDDHKAAMRMLTEARITLVQLPPLHVTISIN